MINFAKYNSPKLLQFIAVSLLIAGLSACSEPPYTNLSNDELKLLLKNETPIFDVRRPEEWRQTGVVEGSKLLTFVDAGGRLKPNFMKRFTAEIGQHDPVILICRTGNRTGTLARYLVEKMGYTQVHNVRNGITQWIREDRPVNRI